jgi:hypothetical protein
MPVFPRSTIRSCRSLRRTISRSAASPTVRVSTKHRRQARSRALRNSAASAVLAAVFCDAPFEAAHDQRRGRDGARGSPPAAHRPRRPDRHAADRRRGLRPRHARLPVPGDRSGAFASALGHGAAPRPRARVRAGFRGAGAVHGRRAPADLHGVPLGSRGERGLPGQRPVFERLASVEPVPPLLVIFGALDAIVPARNAKLYERVPGAKVVVLDGIGSVTRRWSRPRPRRSSSSRTFSRPIGGRNDNGFAEQTAG